MFGAFRIATAPSIRAPTCCHGPTRLNLSEEREFASLEGWAAGPPAVRDARLRGLLTMRVFLALAVLICRTMANQIRAFGTAENQPEGGQITLIFRNVVKPLKCNKIFCFRLTKSVH